MNYNLLDEDDNKFVVGNGDSSFSIAKYGLDDGFMEKLRMLPRVGYADGGMVQPEPIAQPGAPIDLPIDALPYNPSSLELGGVSPASIYAGRQLLQAQQEAANQRSLDLESANLAEETARQERLSKAFNLTPAEQQTAFTTAQPAAQPTALPTEQTPSVADNIPGYMKIGMGQGQTAPFMLPEDIRAGYEKMQQGTMAQAKAHADAAVEQAKLYEQQAADLQKNENARLAELNKLDQETATLQKDIATQKIDPSRIWTNASTGNRVTAGISLLLGGLSQGLTGAKSNPAMDVINNAIDRDIDAQKAELGKKQNLLSLNLQKYGRLDQAFQATKMQIMAVTQAQINQQAAKMGSKQALAAAQVATGQMDVQLAMLKNQLASAYAKDQMMNKPEGLTAKDLMKLDQETRSRMVQMPNGNYMEAFNEKSADEVKKAQGKFIPIQDLAKQFYVEMERGRVIPQGITPSAFQSMRQQRAEALEQSMTVELKNLFELGALTKDDMRLITPLVPEIGKIVNPEAQKAAVDFILERVNSRLNAVYSSNVPGLNPSGRKSRETSIFVRP